MATSRVKTNLFLTFEIAAKWQNVCYTQRSYRLISLNQPINMICFCDLGLDLGSLSDHTVTYNYIVIIPLLNLI